MIKCIEFPDKTFATKEEMFDELIKNEKLIIAEKCSNIYSDKCSVDFIIPDGITVKTMENMKTGHVYPIVSTTRFFDSHKDVHFDGCFNKTVKEQQGKVNYCLDHELRYDSVIAWDTKVKMFIEDIPWSMVGKKYSGTTQALIFDIKEEDFRRKDVLSDIKNKVSAFQNSIRMQYITIKLGVKSDKPEHKEYKSYYDSKISEIANSDEVDKDGYFWGVEVLAIKREASLVVAGGSNSATAIQIKEQEPPKGTTDKIESSRQSDTVFINEFKEILSKHLKN